MFYYRLKRSFICVIRESSKRCIRGSLRDSAPIHRSAQASGVHECFAMALLRSSVRHAVDGLKDSTWPFCQRAARVDVDNIDLAFEDCFSDFLCYELRTFIGTDALGSAIHFNSFRLRLAPRLRLSPNELPLWPGIDEYAHLSKSTSAVVLRDRCARQQNPNSIHGSALLLG